MMNKEEYKRTTVKKPFAEIGMEEIGISKDFDLYVWIPVSVKHTQDQTNQRIRSRIRRWQREREDNALSVSKSLCRSAGLLNPLTLEGASEVFCRKVSHAINAHLIMPFAVKRHEKNLFFFLFFPSMQTIKWYKIYYLIFKR